MMERVEHPQFTANSLYQRGRGWYIPSLLPTNLTNEGKGGTATVNCLQISPISEMVVHPQFIAN